MAKKIRSEVYEIEYSTVLESDFIPGTNKIKPGAKFMFINIGDVYLSKKDATQEVDRLLNRDLVRMNFTDKYRIIKTTEEVFEVDVIHSKELEYEK